MDKIDQNIINTPLILQTYKIAYGAQPTGTAPAIAAIWLAQKRIPTGVHPPEGVIDPEPFFKELVSSSH